jgi:hypothetical protein
MDASTESNERLDVRKQVPSAEANTGSFVHCVCADMTNGWILCHGALSSNEKMLEEIAIDSTGSRPTVLVAEDLVEYERQCPGLDITADAEASASVIVSLAGR